MLKKIVIAAAALISAASANAAVLIYTAPAFNGVEDGSNIGPVTVASWNVVIPGGQSIVSAVFTSNFGNTEVDSSALGFLTLAGITVGECPDSGPCAEGPGLPVNYVFAPSEFASLIGNIDLIYDQTGCCVIRLDESTLTITTQGVVPEPASWAMMIAGFGLTGAVMRRRRTAIVA